MAAGVEKILDDNCYDIKHLTWQERGGGRMPGIRVKEGEPFEKALRRFTKTCEKAGIMSEIRKHQHFEKPSARRKRKLNAAKRKNQKRLQQQHY